MKIGQPRRTFAQTFVDMQAKFCSDFFAIDKSRLEQDDADGGRKVPSVTLL